MRQLTFFAILIALAGGTAFAQQDMGNSSVTGATYATGVVESIDGSQLTLLDDAEQVVTILIVEGTVGAEDHPVGSRVRVNFHHNESGQTVADVIQGASGEIQDAEGEVQLAAVATEPAATETETGTADVPTPSPAPAPIYVEDPADEATMSLPRTASPLAAIGLLGLLSLGGALVIRFSH